MHKLNEKIDSIQIHIKTLEKSNLSKNDLISTFLSSEFKEKQESTTKTVKNEMERKLEVEILKIKNQKNLLIYFFAFISTLYLFVTTTIYLK